MQTQDFYENAVLIHSFETLLCAQAPSLWARSLSWIRTSGNLRVETGGDLDRCWRSCGVAIFYQSLESCRTFCGPDIHDWTFVQGGDQEYRHIPLNHRLHHPLHHGHRVHRVPVSAYVCVCVYLPVSVCEYSCTCDYPWYFLPAQVEHVWRKSDSVQCVGRSEEMIVWVLTVLLLLHCSIRRVNGSRSQSEAAGVEGCIDQRIELLTWHI